MLRWNTALFIFFGEVSASVVIFVALEFLISRKRPNPFVITAAIAAFSSILVTAMKFSEPSRVLNLFARPTFPAGGAHIFQIALLLVSLYMFYRALRTPLKKCEKRFMAMAVFSTFIGYFALSLLIAQMPLIAKGINNRIFL